MEQSWPLRECLLPGIFNFLEEGKPWDSSLGNSLYHLGRRAGRSPGQPCMSCRTEACRLPDGKSRPLLENRPLPGLMLCLLASAILGQE